MTGIEQLSVMNQTSAAKMSRARKAKRKPKAVQRFSSYMVFGFSTTLCLGLFFMCYAVVLVAVWPLMDYHDESIAEEHPLRLHQVVQQMKVPEKLKQELQKEHHIPGQERISGMAAKFKEDLRNWREGAKLTDRDLLHEAQEEFNEQRQKKQKERASHLRKIALANAAGSKGIVATTGADGKQRNGFMVLGMHRSGTSMLSGLLVTSCGYTVGGPLIGSAFDNEKGFFERIDAVLQNDEFMENQRVWWSANVIAYDYQKALDAYESKEISFKKGTTALAFLNNPSNAPWIQKDPRMCITLKTWLKIMNNEPAIVFTYRHPLEVAMSLKRREDNFPLQRGLRLWIVYNMRAIQNSKGLCIVYSSNDAILDDPLTEVQRISDELTSKCGVPKPPRRLSQDDVDKFVDPNLQHNKKKRAEEEEKLPVIATYNNGDCVVRDFASDTPPGSVDAEREQRLYGQAMRMYCDFQSGKAYDDDYEWPHLE